MKATWVGLAIATLIGGPVAAAPSEVVWPTFIRTGPDQRYAVMDELLRGQMVDVLSCEGDWCRAQFQNSAGYVLRAALAQGPATPLVGAKSTECFDSRRSGYEDGEVWRFCR